MDKRIVEIFNKEKSAWEEIEFSNLEVGSIFRFFDNGERYVNKNDGNNVWVATSKPYLNDDGVLQIDTLY